MKKSMVLLLSGLLCFGVFGLVGCEKTNINYRLQFDSNGGSTCHAIESGEITSMKLPNNPTRENYIFDGWYWDEGVWNKPFTINSILDQPISDYMDMTVYAKWKGVDVSVVLQDDGERTEIIEYGAPYTLSLPDIENGDVFLGWQTLQENGEAVMMTDSEGISLAPCDFLSLTVSPLWKSGKIELTFDAQGGNLTQTQRIVWTGEKFGELPTPTRIDYIFQGWSLAKDGSAISATDTVALTEDATLYALWSKEESLEIIFNGNGSTSGSMSSLISKTNTVTLPKNTYVKTGYLFDGWKYGETIYQDGESVALEYTRYEFIAIWRKITFQVAFSANCSSAYGIMSNQTYSYGEAMALNKNAFHWDGYLFDGWKVQGSDEVYADGATVSFTAAQDEIILLQAQWKPITYNVYFKAFESDPDDLTQSYSSYLYNETWRLYDDPIAKGVTRTGYHVTYWRQLNGSDAGKEYNVSTNYDWASRLTDKEGDTIFFVAVWAPHEYILKYCSDNHGILAEQNLKYDEEAALLPPMSTLTKQGFRFVAWRFTGSDLAEEYKDVHLSEGELVKNITSVWYGYVYAYPVWESVDYTVKLIYDDGSGREIEYQKTYGESLSINVSDFDGVRTGHTLAGFRIGATKLIASDEGVLCLDGDYSLENSGEVILQPMWRYQYQGEGTKNSPYLVDSADGMENMPILDFILSDGQYSTNKLYFAFTTDIDMTGRTFIPIGFLQKNTFYGIIDGRNHTVSNLSIQTMADSVYYGNLGFVCVNKGKIKNLYFENCTAEFVVASLSGNVGFLCGQTETESIENCSMTNCVLRVDASAMLYCGGLYGNAYYVDGQTVAQNAFFKGEIFIESNSNVEFGVLAGNGYKGGLVACGAQASVSIKTDREIDFYGVGARQISGCYTLFTATLEGVGIEVYEINRNIALGYEKDSYDYYYSDASTITYNGEHYVLNGVGSTADANLKDSAWVQENLPRLSTAAWTMEYGYPALESRPMQRIEIASREEFIALSGRALTEEYLLLCDVDLSGVAWVAPDVYGVFDGNGHTVSGCSLSAVDGSVTKTGLFACNYGTIKNLIVENSSIVLMGTQVNLYAGGVAAYNEGKIAYVKMSGTVAAHAVNGAAYVGGIAGYNVGEILCSYTDCTLSGASDKTDSSAVGEDVYVFGIAYTTAEKGSVFDCYSKGMYEANALAANNNLYLGGVSLAATDCFSFANLQYTKNDTAKGVITLKKEPRIVAVAEGLSACSSQTINGVAQAGISRTILLTEGYLTGTLGWQKFVDETTLEENVRAAWKFTDGGEPTLYFE